MTFFSDCPLNSVNDLRLHEVRTAFLDQKFVSLTELQAGLPLEVCFDSVFTQAIDTQDRFCHFLHMEVTLSQVASASKQDLTFSVIVDCTQSVVDVSEMRLRCPYLESCAPKPDIVGGNDIVRSKFWRSV